MAPLTAARLIHFDDKCGNSSISKGEKCSKGQSTPAQRGSSAGKRVGEAVTGAAFGLSAGNALLAFGGMAGGNRGTKVGPNAVKSGPALLGGAGSTTGGMNGKRTPSAQQMKNMKSAKIPRIGGKGAALVAGGALAAGALAALAMRKKKKATGKKSNFDPIAAAKAKENEINN